MATEDHDAGVVGSSAGSDESSVHAAPALLPIIWADPEHLPEHLAIFSVRHFGHRAASGVQKLREQNPRPAAPRHAICMAMYGGIAMRRDTDHGGRHL